MRILKEKDLAVVKVATLLADYDRESIANFYQPIIGYAAHALYLTLWSEAKNQKNNEEITHRYLFTCLGMDATVFVDARKALEATGLLKTFLKENGDQKTYVYQLYAPKSPKSFFDNTLLLGMLIKAIGEEQVNRLKSIYQIDLENLGNDISASFVEVYRPNFDDESFKKALVATPNAIGHTNGKISSSFSYEKFFDYLSKISKISSKDFSKKDMKEIERLATLYGLDEENSANGVASIYDIDAPKGKHIDFEKLVPIFQNVTNYEYLLHKKKNKTNQFVSGKTVLASKINMMESMSPKDYLSVLQNGSTPAVSDLYLINELSKNFHLSNPVINVVVDYVLNTNNNILSKGYTTKVAASLARENITSVVDAMNYFRKVTSKNDTFKDKKDSKPVSKATKEEDLNWDQLINELDEGEDNGKA